MFQKPGSVCIVCIFLLTLTKRCCPPSGDHGRGSIVEIRVRLGQARGLDVLVVLDRSLKADQGDVILHERRIVPLVGVPLVRLDGVTVLRALDVVVAQGCLFRLRKIFDPEVTVRGMSAVNLP